MDFDIDKIRKMTIDLNQLEHTENLYNFYYDETNNIRKFYLKENDFNDSSKSNFVLGGIVFEKTRTDFKDCFDKLNLQNNVTEVKLKNLATGDFISCLKSKKLRIFLDFLFNSDLYIHYSSLNFLYFSLVDIVDSAETEPPLGFKENRILKNILFKIAKKEKEKIVKLFFAYEYPNVKSESLKDFLSNLISILEPYVNEKEFQGNLPKLIKILNEAKEVGKMPFITDEVDHQLIENFIHFYLRTIYIFKNSNHVFDREVTIEELLKDYNLKSNTKDFKNYVFEDSKNNLFIQASDIFIGVLGKYFNFLNENTIDEIKSILYVLDDVQFSNFELILEIIQKSNKKNRAFIHNTLSNEEMEKEYVINNFFK
ncbi:hypothetical protein OA88_12575 [Flavobacterium sp. JRM]|nr:hypothetical protein OA88_12575 [Flavobacterium sp. JRM]